VTGPGDGIPHKGGEDGAHRRFDALRELRPAPGLTRTDETIVHMLQRDGRSSVSNIARQAGLATKAVSRRVDELIDAGVIDVTAVTTPEALGYQAGALLGIQVLRGADVPEIVDRLWRDQRIDYMSVVGGPYRIIAEVFGRDAADLRRAIEHDISQIPGIGEVELFPYLLLYYQRFRFDPRDPDDSAVSASFGRNRGRELDFMDKRIVAELNLDGRRRFQSLGDQLGVSESQVRRRVNRMVTSGTLRIMAMANPRSLGYGSLAWLALNVAGDEEVRVVAKRLAEIPGVIYIIITSGRFDLFVDVVARDHDDLLRLLDEEVRAVTGVQHLEAWLHLDLHWRPLRPLLALRPED
jgi:DNA-binding Lrp family transcriptional regulator